jgi:hypothetical protein
MLLDLVTVAVLAWVGSRLLLTARAATGSSGRARAREVARGLRLHHFLLAIPALAAVITAAVVLVSIPGLSFGWWTAIGGEGNPVVGTSTRTSGTPLEWLVPVVFIALLVPALPLLVEREERMFRDGSEHRTFVQRVGRGFLFGMVHAIVGIPIGAAIALSFGGWYLTWANLRGYRAGGRDAALLESTRSHLAYNLTILAVVAVALAADALT